MGDEKLVVGKVGNDSIEFEKPCAILYTTRLMRSELALMMLLMILLRVRSEKSNFKLKYTILVLK